MKALSGLAVCTLMVIGIHFAASCSIASNWRPQDFVTRMEKAEIAFKGRVIHMPQPPPSHGLYTVKFEVDCVYKTSLPITKGVNVSRFGYVGGLCISTMVTEGESYIVLARAPYAAGESVMTHEVNVQPAAETAAPNLIASVQNVHSCQKPK
ncbi:uncharacterized protein LOC117294514 [Asterias rubens]|uniref:uncharacterized protein LOC117294514 n=1 Tax=Asterias rubens TaxID=7604 RepID=UPI001455761D|nr:uncharacterized protein LOC117294514 [Asterias rubens]